MASINSLVFTADRAIYAVPAYKYQFFPPRSVISQGCSPTLQMRCEADAEWQYVVCPVGLAYCSPRERAADTADVGNLACERALAMRRACASNRDVELQGCVIQYGCADGNTCIPDVNWGWFGTDARGTCCPTGNVACGGGCYAPCPPQQYFDGRSCTCRCAPVTCGPGRTQNPVTCQCTCPPQVCSGGKFLDQTTCMCRCPDRTPPLTDCGICVDTRTDPRHCGACNNPCAPGEGCCDGVRTALTTNQHCGRCDIQCASGWKCCNRICTRLGTSSNCADCGKGCAAPLACVGGSCQCPIGTQAIGACCCPQGPGFGCCNGVCTSLVSATNCGACGVTCNSVR